MKVIVYSIEGPGVNDVYLSEASRDRAMAPRKDKTRLVKAERIVDLRDQAAKALKKLDGLDRMALAQMYGWKL